MKRKIIRTFRGKINGIVFNNSEIFRIRTYILTGVEDRFGECYNKLFVKNMRDAIEAIWFGGGPDLDKVKSEFAKSIKEADSFKDIFFRLEGFNDRISFLNKNRGYHFKQGYKPETK